MTLSSVSISLPSVPLRAASSGSPEVFSSSGAALPAHTMTSTYPDRIPRIAPKCANQTHSQGVDNHLVPASAARSPSTTDAAWMDTQQRAITDCPVAVATKTGDLAEAHSRSVGCSRSQRPISRVRLPYAAGIKPCRLSPISAHSAKTGALPKGGRIVVETPEQRRIRELEEQVKQLTRAA